MKNQGKLNGTGEQDKLPDGAGVCDNEVELCYGKINVTARWFRMYLVTVLSTVAISAMLLFMIGAESGGESRFTAVADKIGNVLIEIDFPMFEFGTDYEGSKDSFVPVDSEIFSDAQEDESNTQTGASVGGLYDYDYSIVPEGYVPIIPMDLSLSSYGAGYINNETGYMPDVSALLKRNLKANTLSDRQLKSQSPLVLIVHTHGTEAYCKDGALYLNGDEDIGRSSDATQNVVAVGKIISDVLNKNGIPTAHCTIMHDNVQYKDSYARAEETIKKYLEEFPTIKLVIDVHRDSVIKSSGEIVRPVTEIEGERYAQVMCVVGSDWAGDNYEHWEDNLSLALKLRELLNGERENLCRPVYLKGNTYNQEISPFSLLLEVGASGNSLEEACRSAELIAKKICDLIEDI